MRRLRRGANLADVHPRGCRRLFQSHSRADLPVLRDHTRTSAPASAPHNGRRRTARPPAGRPPNRYNFIAWVAPPEAPHLNRACAGNLPTLPVRGGHPILRFGSSRARAAREGRPQCLLTLVERPAKSARRRWWHSNMSLRQCFQQRASRVLS